jgi:hypothetical protein
MTPYTDHVIITVSPDMLPAAMREMRSIAPDAAHTEDFSDGIYVIRVRQNAVAFLEALARRDPAYIKHAMPVCMFVALSGARGPDLDAIVQGSLACVDLKAGEPFSVQCRFIDVDNVFTTKDVEIAIGERFEAMGAIPTFSDTEVSASDTLRVISVFVRATDCFIGFSTVAQNLNEHCDEYRVLSRKPRLICRAEHKLAEALRKFRVVAQGQYAIDLGASPGGWTYVLALQAEGYGSVVKAALASGVCASICLWEFGDKDSWLEDPNFSYASPDADCTPWDDDLKPKPAHQAIRDAFAARAGA